MSTMKTFKPALQNSAQEKCGVWLDTIQLKGKAKQKRLSRPISKLLNPFVQGGGYSLAVALNFTQTPMKMPATKQSSLSAFYTSQRRVLNKMSTSEVPKMDSVQSSLSTLTTTTAVSSGTKRRHAGDLEKPDESKPNGGHDGFSFDVMESQRAVWQKNDETRPKTFSYTDFEFNKEQCEEFNPPQSKKRFTDSSLTDDSQSPPLAWSQDPLLTLSQYSDSECNLTNQKCLAAKNLNNYEPSFPNSVQSEEAFGFNLDLEGKTSTQKFFKHLNSSQMDDEKENTKALFSNSPCKDSSLSHFYPLSNQKWTQPKIASSYQQNDEEESHSLQLKWRKPKSSLLKKQDLVQQKAEFDEDSLAMLFTQDSEGFRVIAHRGLQTRIPFTDQTNACSGMVKNGVSKFLVEDDDMLFTQDSQGNMVIKH